MPSEEAPARRSHTHVARLHNRVPSYGKGLHRVNSKAHNADLKVKQQSRATSPAHSPGDAPMNRSTSERNLSRNGSTTSLKKNTSHISLRRNRSSAEVKKPRPSAQLKRTSSEKGLHHSKASAKSTVHFDLGNDADAQDDGWTEASGSTSPNVSRSGSIGGSSGRNSAKRPSSAVNSQPQSPERTTRQQPIENWASNHYTTPDAKQITSRLLQRTPTNNAPPKMSSVSATVTPGNHSPEPYDKANGVPGSVLLTGDKEQVVSRFVGSTSGTPRDDFSTYAKQINHMAAHRALEDPKRVKSMGNLTQKDTVEEEEEDSDEEERALAPRHRKSGTNGSTYNPLQQSRTQQKLWLQRASSNIEPMAPQAGINGIPAPGSATLVNASYDGRDPRIRMQLEKTGMEYLVVRRYQDPVGRAIKRLAQLPGTEKILRIPDQHVSKRNSGLGAGRYGLSQSMRETRSRPRGEIPSAPRTARSSFENEETSGVGGSRDGADGDDNGTSALLRSIWDKSLDLSASA